MIPLSHTASLSSPGSHSVVGLPFEMMTLLVFVSLIAGNAAAVELTTSSSISAKMGVRLSRIEFSRQSLRVRAATRRSHCKPAQMIIRPNGSTEFIPTTDARSDITSVRVPPPSLSGESSEKEENSFLGPDNSSNLLLPGDTGKYEGCQAAPGVVVDGLANGAVATWEVAFSSDDFLGHIREFLQTKK